MVDAKTLISGSAKPECLDDNSVFFM